MADLTQGDAGVVIEVTLDENVSDGSAFYLIAENPTGVSKTLTAALKGGETAVVQYTTESSDFNASGRWKCQVRVVQSGKDRRSSIFTLAVEEAL